MSASAFASTNTLSSSSSAMMPHSRGDASSAVMSVDALFQVKIHGLEDIALETTNQTKQQQNNNSNNNSGGLQFSLSARGKNRRPTTIADSLFDLLQYEYSVTWKSGKEKGTTEKRHVKSKYVDETFREDYSFIDEHSQHMQHKRQQRPKKKRSIANMSGIIPTSNRDDRTPRDDVDLFNEMIGKGRLAGHDHGTPSSPMSDSSTTSSGREGRRKQNRKSLSTMSNPLVRKSRTLVYAVDFEHELDMLVSMKLDMPDRNYAFMPRVKERTITFEIKEWQGRDSSTAATITANLVEFTTPLTVTGQLKRTVLFPVRLKNNKTCKLRATISSIWLNSHQLQAHLRSLQLSAGEKQRKKYSEYFVVDEDEQQFFTAEEVAHHQGITSGFSAMPAYHMQTGILTPRVIRRRDSDSPPTSDSGNAPSSQSTVVNAKGKSIAIPPLPLGGRSPRSSGSDGSPANSLSVPISPRAADFGLSPRSTFTQDATHFVAQLRKMKEEMSKLQQEKKALKSQLQEKALGTEVLESDSSVAARLKMAINKMYDQCDGIKEQISQVEHTVNKIHGRLDLFERDRSGMPQFQVSPGDSPRTIGLVYLDIHNKTRMWDLSQDTMVNVLDTYEDLLADCLDQCSGSVLQTDGDATVCCFASCKMAIRFCLLLQIKLHNAAWPADLLELDDTECQDDDASQQQQQHFHTKPGLAAGVELDNLPTLPRSNFRPKVRGLGVRMGIEVGRLMELSDSSPVPTVSLSSSVKTSSGRALLMPLESDSEDDSEVDEKQKAENFARLSTLPTLRYFFHESSGQFVFFGNALRRAVVISQYAQGGQIFISDYVWTVLQEENKLLRTASGEEDKYPPIRTVVQDLGTHYLHGLAMEDIDRPLPLDEMDVNERDDGQSASLADKERLRLVIPEMLHQEREYSKQQIEELQLCASQSFLINALHSCLDQWREDLIEKIKDQLNDFEESMLKINVLQRILEEEEKRDSAAVGESQSTLESSWMHLKNMQQDLASQLMDARNQCEWLESRMTKFATVLQLLSAQVLSGKHLGEGEIDRLRADDMRAMVEAGTRTTRELITSSNAQAEIAKLKTEYEKKLREKDLQIQRLSSGKPLQYLTPRDEEAERELDLTIKRTLSMLDMFSFDDSSDDESDDEVELVTGGTAGVQNNAHTEQEPGAERVGVVTPAKNRSTSKPLIRSAFQTPPRGNVPKFSSPMSSTRRTPRSPALERLKNQNEVIRQRIDMYKQLTPPV